MKRALGPALKILALRMPALAIPVLAIPALLFTGTMRAADAPVVVTSIKPIHSLVSAIMQGVGEPELIVDGAASPHTYNLKPSNARALQDAKVIFWVGPGLEAFLEKPLQALGRMPASPNSTTPPASSSCLSVRAAPSKRMMMVTSIMKPTPRIAPTLTTTITSMADSTRISGSIR